MSHPNFIASAFRSFSLMPHFRGKSRIESLIEPIVPMGNVDTLVFPEGFKMNINSESGHEKSYYFRNKEPETFNYIKSFLKPNMCFWDCGANIGFYSLLAAKLVGPNGNVCAFEPTPSTMDRLKKNVADNAFQNVNYHLCALGRVAGTAEIFQQNSTNTGENALRPSHDGSKIISECEIKTIDQMISENNLAIPDLIKVDVEGSELDLLMGGREFFTKHRPKMILEIASGTLKRFGANSTQLRKFIVNEIGYKLVWPNLGRLTEVEDNEPLPHEVLLGESHGSNYILEPK